jgi:hypothetical protein
MSCTVYTSYTANTSYTSYILYGLYVLYGVYGQYVHHGNQKPQFIIPNIQDGNWEILHYGLYGHYGHHNGSSELLFIGDAKMDFPENAITHQIYVLWSWLCDSSQEKQHDCVLHVEWMLNVEQMNFFQKRDANYFLNRKRERCRRSIFSSLFMPAFHSPLLSEA